MADVKDISIETKNKLNKKYTCDAKKLELVGISLEYVFKKMNEKKKDKVTNAYVDALNINEFFIYSKIIEIIENGFALDGINYVIYSNAMVLPTYHAFKNKIYMVYPESVIDLQLIREGDKYNFAKESGSVVYSHSIANPFTVQEPKIIGAYCIIKNSRGEFLETLNLTDFQKMKNIASNTNTWKNWESEFWKKSVIKRACKTHFHDITKNIDAQDNEGSDLEKFVKADESTKSSIIEAKKAQNESRA